MSQGPDLDPLGCRSDCLRLLDLGLIFSDSDPFQIWPIDPFIIKIYEYNLVLGIFSTLDCNGSNIYSVLTYEFYVHFLIYLNDIQNDGQIIGLEKNLDTILYK